MKGCPASAKSVVVEVKNFTAKKVVRYPQPSVRERTPLVCKAVMCDGETEAKAAPVAHQGGTGGGGRAALKTAWAEAGWPWPVAARVLAAGG